LQAVALRMPGAGAAGLRRRRDRLEALKLGTAALEQGIARGRRDLARLSPRLPDLQKARFRDARLRLAALDRTRQSYDHGAVLARGFVLVRDADGALVTSRATPAPGAALELQFADGRLDAVAAGGSPSGKAASKTSRTPPAPQGSLFDD
ncbi:exodeoxyribonuclease VII large subunit, partial [Mangrovicoccus algicola]|nr:exodeoxyribonuclease VII large subunit [Mangrovicoccus algicola]